MPQLAKLISTSLTSIPVNKQVYIGYSGGVDSHVLLHLCASYRQQLQITAVYIHHGLQPEAESWAEHCRQTAEGLGVGFVMRRVNAQPDVGESPEEAARNARYTAFKSLLKVGDLLMLAQHRQDQMETVLLQLFRGAGLRGLSGMPERIGFGNGHMLRPLLPVSKQEILDYALEHQLHWIEDPSNQSNDYDRNYLRNAVIPLLAERWPACDKTVARSAGHCAQAQLLLTGLADGLLAEVLNPADNTLSILGLLDYPVVQQHLILRQWFQVLGLKMPTQAFLGRILAEVVAAQAQRDPVLSGQGFSVRRFRGHLYCIASGGIDNLHDSIWPKRLDAILVPGGQLLQAVQASAGLLQSQWQTAQVVVRGRQGGEKIRLPGRVGRHYLKKLYQEAGIPPWQRPSIPLIYLDGQLAAVGDLWISADFYALQPDACIRFVLKKAM